jgi:CheY-like chemotaxis protein
MGEPLGSVGMRPKLLLADDSITVQRVIELTLADEGLDVLTVGDGVQALATIEREQPDIVLADVTMPGRDGYGVAEFVKRSPKFAERTRVVLLTNAFEPIDRARADRLGVDAVLTKPFEPQVAIDLVRQVLSQSPVLPAPDPAEAAAGVAAAKKMMAAAASGHPFEPGAAGAKSTPAELDDYFKRLDEALASAGHRPSADSAPTPSATKTKPKGRPMIEAQESASTDVTLGDAFSALLAAEQGEPSAAALPASAFSASALVSEVSHDHHHHHAAQPASAPQPVISEELLETVIRKVLEQMSDRLVRELVGPKVLDVAERLVREEIARLKAEAESL